MSRSASTALIIAVFLVSGCGTSRQAPQVAAARPVPRQAPLPPPTAMPSYPVPVGSESLWHLRAGLNVAALSCRGQGRRSLTADYSRLLSRHRALLASAYGEEQRRNGRGLDRHLTQVYNRFAYRATSGGFCARAVTVASQAAGMDSPTLSARAGRLLSELS